MTSLGHNELIQKFSDELATNRWWTSSVDISSLKIESCHDASLDNSRFSVTRSSEGSNWIDIDWVGSIKYMVIDNFPPMSYSHQARVTVCIHTVDMPTMTSWKLINSSPPGQNGGHFADDTFRRIFMKSFIFWLKFHWSLFVSVQLTLPQHWFR